MLRPLMVAFALAYVPASGNPLASLSVRSAEIAPCWGDVNSDARVDVTDAQLIARFAIGMRVPATQPIVARGDVTGDGSVNVSDAQQVARHSVGLPAARRIGNACTN
jgi:hypothetical protein